MSTLVLAMADRLVVATHDSGSWRCATRLEGRAPRAIAAAGGVLLCGTRGSGLWRSRDGGATWQQAGPHALRAATVMAVAARVDRGAETGGGAVSGGGGGGGGEERGERVVAYCGTEPSEAWRGDDDAADWRRLAPLTALPSSSDWSFPPRPDTHHVRCIAIDPMLAEQVYVCIEAGALVSSTDGGTTWRDRVDGSPIDTHTLATHPRDHGRLYSAAGDGYFESRDHGATWERPREGLRHGYMWSVVAHPDEPELRLVSAATGPRQAHAAETADSFVYRRSRHSEWEHCSVGLPESHGTTASVFANDARSADRVWLANNRGVFLSDDFGESWNTVPLTLPAELAGQRVNGLLVI